MCGIFGVFQRDGSPVDPEALRAMARVIEHRGPDDHGTHLAPGVAIGNQRLSIIDLAGGHQPFLSADGKVAVVQNGEIYNHVELRAELEAAGVVFETASDTEVLLRLYEREGRDMLPRLNGMFCLAVWDARTETLLLARDRLGVKPLYVHDDGNRLLFGSEIKSLLAAGIPRALDEEALHHFLSLNFVPQPFTMFRGVRHLPPGHWMEVTRGGSRTARWWSLAGQAPVEQDEAAWREAFLEKLDAAVQIRLRADVPFGAFLSGGLDSSSVVGLMARHLPRGVKTFSIGFGDSRFDESRFSTIAADRFGTDHTLEHVEVDVVDLWPRIVHHCDQPHGDVSFLPTYRLSELAVRHVKMVLTGDGGDELFGGYSKYASFFQAPEASGESEAAFRRRYYEKIGLFSDRSRGELYGPEVRARLADCDTYGLLEPLYEEAAGYDRINQALYLDVAMLLPGNNLVKPDRMPMAVSLEARNPFMDYRVAEFAFTMPGDLKVRGDTTRYLYKKAVEPLIGEELTYREKQMFTVPIGDWFQAHLAGFTEDVLLTGRATDRGLFDPGRVRGFVEAHLSGEANHTREIRALVAIELWARAFLDRTSLAVPGWDELGLRRPNAPS